MTKARAARNTTRDGGVCSQWRSVMDTRVEAPVTPRVHPQLEGTHRQERNAPSVRTAHIPCLNGSTTPSAPSLLTPPPQRECLTHRQERNALSLRTAHVPRLNGNPIPSAPSPLMLSPWRSARSARESNERTGKAGGRGVGETGDRGFRTAQCVDGDIKIGGTKEYTAAESDGGLEGLHKNSHSLADEGTHPRTRRIYDPFTPLVNSIGKDPRDVSSSPRDDELAATSRLQEVGAGWNNDVAERRTQPVVKCPHTQDKLHISGGNPMMKGLERILVIPPTSRDQPVITGIYTPPHKVMGKIGEKNSQRKREDHRDSPKTLPINPPYDSREDLTTSVNTQKHPPNESTNTDTLITKDLGLRGNKNRRASKRQHEESSNGRVIGNEAHKDLIGCTRPRTRAWCRTQISSAL